MTRLYWKIFLSFWAVIILTVAVTFTVNSVWFRDEVDNKRFNALRDSLASVSEDGQRVLDQSGRDGLRTWLRIRQASQPFPPLLIIDKDGEELLGRPLPPRLNIERLNAGPRRMGRVRVNELRGPNGETFRMILPRFEPRLGGWFLQPQARALFPLLLVLVSGGACLWLAGYLTRPIRAFREAGTRIAGGDLGARVGPEMARRSDEFGDLAVDFDRMAERIEALLDSQKQLLRDVSHELRSPLARLHAAVGLIRQRYQNAPDEDLDRIEREAVNLDKLIGQVLDFVRLENLDKIDRQPLDLNGIASAIVDDARYEAEPMDKVIEFHPADRADIEADEILIYRAIENIVRNAVHHSRKRTEVRIGRAPASGLTIEVTDDGPGIDPGDAEKIFEPFFTRPSGEFGTGAGIGLAIARRAIELHGGSIRARNSTKSGLSVLIELI